MSDVETRPSSAAIWTKCALAPRLMAMAPPAEESDPAREGTCAAWVAEMVLTGHAEACHDMVDEQHPNGWVVDAAMAYHVQRYVDMLRERGGQIDAERKVRLNDKIAGTPDSFAVFSNGHLFVDDLKYGFEIVDVTTPQVAIYAGAILRQVERRGHRIARVTLGIYQPRAYHPMGIHRQRTLWPEELMREVHEIETAAERAHSDAAMAIPGAHCRHCSGAAYCSAVSHEVYATFHRMFNGEQRQMTPAEMAAELEFLAVADRMFKVRRDSVHAEAEARMARGERIPGWMKESGYGRRKWKVSAATIEALTGIDPVDRTKMITPAEMERRKVAPELVNSLTETPRTKATLKPVPKGYYAARFGETE